MDIQAARDMWMHDLEKDIMRPIIIEIFDELWAEASKTGSRNAKKQFQKLCQDIKTWNETQIRTYTDKATARSEYFSDLVAAIFVATVKILSSIKARKDAQKVNVEVPNNDLFVHNIIRNMAENLYWEPEVMTEPNRAKKQREICQRLKGVIYDTVYYMCPRKAVLHANIGSNVVEDVGEEGEGAEGAEEEEPAADEEVPPDTEAFTREPSKRDEEEAELSEEEDPETQKKVIGPPVEGAPPTRPEVESPEDEALFPDASEDATFDK